MYIWYNVIYVYNRINLLGTNKKIWWNQKESVSCSMVCLVPKLWLCCKFYQAPNLWSTHVWHSFEVYHSRMVGLTNNEVKHCRWIGERAAGAWGGWGASCCEDSFKLKQREVSRIESQHTHTAFPLISRRVSRMVHSSWWKVVVFTFKSFLNGMVQIYIYITRIGRYKYLSNMWLEKDGHMGDSPGILGSANNQPTTK